MVSACERRRQVAYAVGRGLSTRRACALLSVARSSLDYESKLAARDAGVLKQISELVKANPRFGYRRIQALLERKSVSMSRDRMCRLWRQGKHQIRRKRRRRRLQEPQPRLKAATRPNHVWAYDFIHDSCAHGRKLKCLVVVDEWTRECLAIEVGGRIPARRVKEVLERLFEEHGHPEFFRSDNGPEFIAKNLGKWLVEREIGTAFIEPGKPWQNGSVESFNDKFRDECLNMEWFRSREEAKLKIEIWRRRYNEHRPHSSLGYRTPNEFKESCLRGQNLPG